MENPNMPVSVSIQQTDYGSTTIAHSSKVSPKSEKSLKTINRTVHTHDTRSINSANSERELFAAESRTPSFLLLSSSAPRHTRMSLDTNPNSETVQIVQRVEFFLHLINQMCIGFVTIYMVWLCLHYGLTKTSLHAFLVTIGFVFLMAEGVMCHYNGNLLLSHYKRQTKTTIHWILQAVGGGLGMGGILYKCIQKGFLLKSIHGKIGFSVLFLCAISMVSGLSALYSSRVKKILSPILNKTIHNFLGLATFVLALVTQYYGYETGFFSRKVTPDLQMLFKVITLVILVLSSLGPIKALYHKCVIIKKHFS